MRNIKGKYTPVDKTVDLERANNAYKIQCEVSTNEMYVNENGRTGKAGRIS